MLLDAKYTVDFNFSKYPEKVTNPVILSDKDPYNNYTGPNQIPRLYITKNSEYSNPDLAMLSNSWDKKNNNFFPDSAKYNVYNETNKTKLTQYLMQFYPSNGNRTYDLRNPNLVISENNDTSRNYTTFNNGFVFSALYRYFEKNSALNSIGFKIIMDFGSVKNIKNILGSIRLSTVEDFFTVDSDHTSYGPPKESIGYFQFTLENMYFKWEYSINKDDKYDIDGLDLDLGTATEIIKTPYIGDNSNLALHSDKHIVDPNTNIRSIILHSNNLEIFKSNDFKDFQAQSIKLGCYINFNSNNEVRFLENNDIPLNFPTRFKLKGGLITPSPKPSVNIRNLLILDIAE